MNQAIAFQRLEGAAILLTALIAYSAINASWWLFIILLLTIDVFMAGYAINNKIGAYVYNIGHSLTAPLLAGAFAYLASSDFLTSLCIIWVAHIGMDRTFGYGLKMKSGFKDTHLGYIGKK